MKWVLNILACAILVTVTTTSAAAVTFDEARHLLARTGFGVAAPHEIEALLPLTYEEAVDEILNSVTGQPVTPLPNFTPGPQDWVEIDPKDLAARKAHHERLREDRFRLRRWWIEEMISTPSPFTERMTLFWHNHFVSTANKVRYAQWLAEQNMLFREFAIGDFKQLLMKVSFGPAMMIYLDGLKNKKDSPNENFARELMELFTLGESHSYTEKDIREAARAFTGWRVKYATGRSEFVFEHHDGSPKTVLGRTGNLDGIDVLDILLSKPRTSIHLTEILWKEFVGGDVDKRTARRLASILRRNDYNLRPMLKAMFMSDGFRNRKYRKALIKSPVDLTIGTLRLFNISSPDYRALVVQQSTMGQSIFDPPDVKGWRGGKDWITSGSILRREIFLRQLSKGLLHRGAPVDVGMAIQAQSVFGRADVSDFHARERLQPGYIQQVLLAVPPVGTAPPQNPALRLTQFLLNPAYHIK